MMTVGVTIGHLTGRALEWQDEVTIFLVLGAIFLSAAAGIEVLPAILPRRLEPSPGGMGSGWWRSFRQMPMRTQ
jgi:hypothetical protein